METYQIFLFIGVVFVFVIKFMKLSIQEKAQRELRYKKIRFLCTKTELSFYKVLSQALGDEFIVCPKVRVADVVTPESKQTRKAWRIAFNQIAMKHFDYVICAAGTLEIIAAVELDDASHQQTAAMKSDKVKNHAAESAGLPLIRIRAAKFYKVDEIKATLTEHGIFTSSQQKNTEMEMV